MTYEEWKGEKKAEAERNPTVGEVIVGKVITELHRVKGAVEKYTEAQRVFGLTAPGFSPRPRKTVQLPKAEYASVVSAINSSYHARFEGQRKGRIAVGNYQYKFEISGFNEYRITGKEFIE